MGDIPEENSAADDYITLSENVEHNPVEDGITDRAIDHAIVLSRITDEQVMQIFETYKIRTPITGAQNIYPDFNTDVYSKTVIDTGAPCTVAGLQWVEAYKSKLSPVLLAQIQEEAGNKLFEFGGGEVRRSLGLVSLPGYLLDVLGQGDVVVSGAVLLGDVLLVGIIGEVVSVCWIYSVNELFHRLVNVLLRGDRDVRRVTGHPGLVDRDLGGALVRVAGHPGPVDRDLGGAVAEGESLAHVVWVVCFVSSPDDETRRMCPGSRR